MRSEIKQLSAVGELEEDGFTAENYNCFQDMLSLFLNLFPNDIITNRSTNGSKGLSSDFCITKTSKDLNKQFPYASSAK